jgi:hypothetical protein
MVIFDKSALNALEIHISKLIHFHFARAISMANCRDFVSKLSGYNSHGHLLSALKKSPVFCSSEFGNWRPVFSEFYLKHKLRDDENESFFGYLKCLFSITLPEMIPIPSELLDMQSHYMATPRFPGCCDLRTAFQAAKEVNELYFFPGNKYQASEFAHLPDKEMYYFNHEKRFEDNHEYFNACITAHYAHLYPAKAPLINACAIRNIESNPDHLNPSELFYLEHKEFFTRYSDYLIVAAFSTSNAIGDGALNSFWMVNPREIDPSTYGLDFEKALEVTPEGHYIACWSVWRPETAWGFEEAPKQGCGDQVLYLALCDPIGKKWTPLGYSIAEHGVAGSFARPIELFDAMDSYTERTADTFKAVMTYGIEQGEIDDWFAEMTYGGQKITLFCGTSNILNPDDEDLTAFIATHHTFEFIHSIVQTSDDYNYDPGLAITFAGLRFPVLAESFIAACIISGPKPIDDRLRMEHMATLYTIPASEKMPMTSEVAELQEKEAAIANAIKRSFKRAGNPMPIITYDPWDYPST